MNLSTKKNPKKFSFFPNYLSFLILFISLVGLPITSWAQDGAISAISLDDDLQIDDDWDDYEEYVVYDPYEKYNRRMFRINDKIYRHVFTPLAKGYDFLFPKRVQKSFNNLFRFTSTPKRFFNNLFQKKYKSSFIEFERLLINATIGIAGLFDPAKHFFHLDQQTEDLGQTLGHYGVKPGPYIIWPIVGPSTRRDTLGTLGDNAFSVLRWAGIYNLEPEDAFRAVSVTKRTNNYSYNVRKNYDRLTDIAIDPYIALQHAYMKNRDEKIKE